MIKSVLLVLGSSAVAASATLVFVGRTVHSSPFQMDVPYGSAVRTTVDPANVWSWHHEFPHTGGTATTVDVLVDIDGNNVMDTEHPWLRVMITDIELVERYSGPRTAWILDGTGKRFAVGGGNNYDQGPVNHVGLTSPIVLPVGSPLRVMLEHQIGDCEVHLIGRVVNL
ncbi:MAG: hypothetical protein IPK26_16605 [Planctomycetes bacterium]|nr:hypothetical protein [Planctomycetota bacterium]